VPTARSRSPPPLQLTDLDPTTLNYDIDDWIGEIRQDVSKARDALIDCELLDSKLARLAVKHSEYKSFFGKELAAYRDRTEELEH
jgi:hypothetical protein